MLEDLRAPLESIKYVASDILKEELSSGISFAGRLLHK